MWCLIKVPCNRFTSSLQYSCGLIGTLGLAFALFSTRAAEANHSEHSLRGPISMTPGSMRLIPELSHGVSVLKTGSLFPVTLITPIASRNIKVGQPIKGMLIEDITLAGKTIAPKGSSITGWVSNVQNPRNVLKSKVTSKNWLNANGAISIHFAAIDPSNGMPKLQIDAEPAPGTPVRGPQDEHELCVHKDGAISVKWSGVKYGAEGVAISAISWATGPFKFITGPVLSGAAGAIQPQYALDKPVLKEDALTRTKGGLVGAVKGLPGGFIITGVANKGGYISIPSGVQLEVALLSDLIIANPVHPKAPSRTPGTTSLASKTQALQ